MKNVALICLLLVGLISNNISRTTVGSRGKRKNETIRTLGRTLAR